MITGSVLLQQAAAGGGSGPVLISSLTYQNTNANGNATNTTPLVPAISTIGANLIVLLVAKSTGRGGTTTAGLTDSQTNFYLNPPNANLTGPNNYRATMFYIINPITSAAHTWSTVGAMPSFAMLAFNLLPTTITGFISAQQFLATTTTSQQPGSISSTGPALSISGYTVAASGITYGVSIDYTGLIQTNIAGTDGVGIGMAYRYSPIAAAFNPTWSSPPTPASSIAQQLLFG